MAMPDEISLEIRRNYGPQHVTATRKCYFQVGKLFTTQHVISSSTCVTHGCDSHPIHSLALSVQTTERREGYRETQHNCLCKEELQLLV